MKPFGWLKHGCVGFWDPLKGARGGYVMWPPFGSNDVRHKVTKFKARVNASRMARYAKHGRDGRAR